MTYRVWRSLPPRSPWAEGERESRLLIYEAETLLEAVEVVDSMYHSESVFPTNQEQLPNDDSVSDGPVYTIEAVGQA